MLTLIYCFMLFPFFFSDAWTLLTQVFLTGMRTFWLFGTQTLYLNTAHRGSYILSLGQGWYQTSPPTRGGPVILPSWSNPDLQHPYASVVCNNVTPHPTLHFPLYSWFMLVCFMGSKKFERLHLAFGHKCFLLFLDCQLLYLATPEPPHYPSLPHASSITYTIQKGFHSFMPAKLASSQLLSTAIYTACIIRLLATIPLRLSAEFMAP